MHMEKIKLHGGNITKLKNHMERNHEYYKNKVDKTRSHLNINICEYMTDEQVLERIKEHGVKNIRKESVGALNFVVTLPKDEKQVNLESWANDIIKATAKAMGLNTANLCGAEVHLDETSPHLHFAFIPLLKNKNDKLVLSADQIATRQKLLNLHDIVQAEMLSKGYTGIYVHNDETRGSRKDSLRQYEKAQDIIKKQSIIIQNQSKELDQYKEIIKQCSRTIDEQIRIQEELNDFDEIAKVYNRVKQDEIEKGEVTRRTRILEQRR